MQLKPKGNEYRTTVVCVDSYADGVPVGRFFNRYSEGGQEFSSLTQFLVKMEDMLDEMKLPQSFTAARSFSAAAESVPAAGADGKPQEGKLATFAVRILFRQNASWQGSVTWLETGQEESFRSVLELILLMDGALREGVRRSHGAAHLPCCPVVE